MLVKDVIDFLNSYAPLDYAEDFDNTGLIVGNKNDKVKGMIICLDSTKEVVQEAIDSNKNLIISFHPIIFNGLKKLSPGNYVNDSILLAVKNDISIFSIHTALDNSIKGVNMKLCEVLGINNPNILIHKSKTIKKITTYIHKKDTDVEEVCVNITFLKHLEEMVLLSLRKAHPYEEIAYELDTLENVNENIGMGMVGELSEAISEEELFEIIKSKLGTKFLKHSKLLKKPIKKIAVLGGSGSFGIEKAISVKADAYITSDLKYHDYFKAEDLILLVDVGHYESEQHTKNLLFEILTKKFPNFAIALAKTNTNPVKYR